MTVPDHGQSSIGWIVGVVDPPKRLATFETHDDAAEYIGTLPDHEQGIYYLDGPVTLPLSRDSSKSDES